MFKKKGVPKKYTGFFAKHRFAIATTTLMGTIVGAGILGIPYVIAKTGFLYGLILLIVIGLGCLFLNLFLGEVVLRTKTPHQTPGYASKYLGKWGKRIMSFSMIVSVYGALTAYLIGEGIALQTIFQWGTPIIYTLIFFAIASFIVNKGIKSTGKAELILVSLLFLIVILIGFFSYDKINLNYLQSHDLAKIFLPYGVILFAYIGFAGVPEMGEELGKEKKKMKSAIIIGSLIPIILYLLFTFVIIGIIGLENFELLEPNQRIATVALSIYSLPVLGIFANLLAVLAMFTSFLALGTALVEVYEYDFHFKRWLAIFLTFIVPLLIVFSKVTTFIAVLGITGAFAGGIDGIMIVLMYWKAKSLGERKPEFSLPKMKIVGIALIIIFVLGIIYQIFSLF